jgi:hypothetical protein
VVVSKVVVVSTVACHRSEEGFGVVVSPVVEGSWAWGTGHGKRMPEVKTYRA